MNDEPKTLEKGESAYRNGGGCICGGVISQSTFDKEFILFWTILLILYLFALSTHNQKYWYSNDEGYGHWKCKVIKMGITEGIGDCIFITKE